MITFQNVSITQPNSGKPILLDASFRFEAHERVGILANPGTGKTLLAKALCGIEPPQRGKVIARNVAWPLGFAGFFHPNLSVFQNLKFTAELNGQEVGHFVSMVACLADLDDALWSDMRDLAPTQRAILAYMCSMVMPSAMIVADDKLTVGGERMRAKCAALFEQKFLRGGLVFLSRNPRQMRQYCRRFFALSNARLIPCETPELAQTLLAQEEEYV